MKSWNLVAAAAALVALSLAAVAGAHPVVAPTTHLKRAAGSASHHAHKTRTVKVTKTSGADSSRVIYIHEPGITPSSATVVDPNACQDSGTDCTDEQACQFWGENCGSLPAADQLGAAGASIVNGDGSTGATDSGTATDSSTPPAPTDVGSTSTDPSSTTGWTTPPAGSICLPSESQSGCD